MFPTFPFSFSAQTLDEGEDKEDDEGSHADSSERLCSTCKANERQRITNDLKLSISQLNDATEGNTALRFDLKQFLSTRRQKNIKTS